jgi:hypothetical protein
MDAQDLDSFYQTTRSHIPEDTGSLLVTPVETSYLTYWVVWFPLITMLQLRDFSVLLLIEETNFVALVRERTISTERSPLVGEVSANFCG